ncbi:hypothetical protein Btru_040985 [Bulinus truncatus]|nr:hypothetical protein Btru_040985 [Bulinus truncatus]
MEPFIKVLLSASGLLYELLNELPVPPPAIVQHASMYFFFLLSGIVDIVIHYGVHLPHGVDYVSMVLALTVEGLLFMSHVHGRSHLNVQFHTLLVYVIGITVVVIILEIKYRNSLMLALARSFLMMLQGSWFWAIGIILYGRGSPNNVWDENSPESVIWSSIYFSYFKFKAGNNVVESRTNCSGLDKCLKQQVEIEILELEYLSETHNKSKYDKLCLYLTRSYDCYTNMKERCRNLLLDETYNSSKANIEFSCEQYGENWMQKDAGTILKNKDSNCKEAIHCVKQIIEKDRTPVNIISAIIDEKYYKNLCANSQKLKSCITKQNVDCENKAMEMWIIIQIATHHQYCIKDGADRLAELQHVIKYGCPRDKCYNDIRNIDFAELVKIKTSEDLTKRKDFCQKRDAFKKCEEKYKTYCEPIASEYVIKTGELLSDLVCSKEEEADRVLKGRWLSLFNKTAYDEICKMKDRKYDCYFQKQQKNKCAKEFDTFEFEKRQLVAKFLCSDEGKRGIALMNSSNRCIDEGIIESEIIYKTEQCRWWSSGLGWPCPFMNRWGACIVEQLQGKCDHAYISFYKQIYAIEISVYKCKKDNKLEEKDRFLVYY